MGTIHPFSGFSDKKRCVDSHETGWVRNHTWVQLIFCFSVPWVQNLLVPNVGNGWVAGGCWDYYSELLWIIPSFPTFSTSKNKPRAWDSPLNIVKSIHLVHCNCPQVPVPELYSDPKTWNLKHVFRWGKDAMNLVKKRKSVLPQLQCSLLSCSALCPNDSSMSESYVKACSFVAFQVMAHSHSKLLWWCMVGFRWWWWWWWWLLMVINGN